MSASLALAGKPAVPETLAEIVDNPALHQYEAHADDGELMGWLKYRREGENLVTVTTQTVPKFRSQGVASALTRRVFEDAAVTGVAIDPACWYVAEFVQRHPEYAKQVADPGW